MRDTTLPDGPLTGVRVIDMSSIGMGPAATQMLGDMGADVIKIETAAGDIFRHVTPQRHPGMSHAFLNLNRNKRSVVLDAKNADDREALLTMVATADVFVSNVRPQALQRLGLDADALCKLNPRLIYCACVGYSAAGPYGGRASLDDVIQAASGTAYFQGFNSPDGPRYVNSAVADKVCALYISNAIGMALYARERTGRGQAIEAPMFESMVAFSLAEHMGGMTFVPPTGPAGYNRILNPYRKPYRSLDGYIAVVPYTDDQWQRFFMLAGRADLAQSPDYKTQSERAKRFDQMYAIVENIVSAKSNADWIAILEDADIPYAPVNSVEDLMADPHLRQSGFWHEVDHPTEGKLTMAGIPIRYSETPGTIRRLAPNLGENTDEVLREYGIVRPMQSQSRD